MNQIMQVRNRSQKPPINVQDITTRPYFSSERYYCKLKTKSESREYNEIAIMWLNVTVLFSFCLPSVSLLPKLSYLVIWWTSLSRSPSMTQDIKLHVKAK